MVDDPAEHNELSHSQPEQLQAMLQRFAALRPSLFAPDRGTVDPRACEAAIGLYGVPGQGGFWCVLASLADSLLLSCSR